MARFHKCTASNALENSGNRLHGVKMPACHKQDSNRTHHLPFTYLEYNDTLLSWPEFH